TTCAPIASWRQRDGGITGVRLSRNFGHQAALSVGLAYAEGEYIAIMDCDLQDPVAVLIELYRTCMHDKLNVCFGIRGSREAPLWLRIAYSAFFRIIRNMADREWSEAAGSVSVL